MDEIQLTQAQQQPLIDPLTKLLSLEFKDGVLNKSRCKLCNSPNRKQAEQMYEEGRQYAAIKKFMDEKGDILTCPSIRNHMQEHYRNQERMAALVEYCDNLSGMMERRKSRRDDLECLINIGYIELARVLTLPTNGDIGREKERSEMIQRTKKSILDVIGMMNEMENADAQVEAVKRKVIDAWASRIEHAKNDTEKQAFIAALKEFRNLI